MKKNENISGTFSLPKQKLNHKAATVLLLLSAVACAYFISAVLAGASGFGFVFFYIVFAALILFPGLFLSEKLLAEMSFWERCIASLPLGSLVLMLGFVVFGSLGFVYLSCLPSLVLFMLFILNTVKQRKNKANLHSFAGMINNNTLFFAVFAFILGICIFAGVFAMAKPSEANNMLYSQDLLWSIGNAASVGHGFPIVDMRTAGGVLHYHYFADASNGLLALFSGQSAWDTVSYFVWPIWALALFGGVYLLAKRLGAGKNIALISASGVFLLAFLDVSNPVHIYKNPNNVLQSYVLLIACFLLLLHMQKQKFKTVAPAVAFVLCLLVLAWSKTVLAILLLCAVLAAFVVHSILNKTFNKILFLLIVVCAAETMLLYALIFSRAIINMEFSFSAAKILEAFVFLLSKAGPVFLIYLLSLVQSFKNFKKLGFVELTYNAMIIGGVLAYCLFGHYSRSENYFVFAAVFLMWLSAAKVLPSVINKKAGKIVVAGLCLIAFLGNTLVLVPMLRHGVQTALRTAGLRPDFVATQASISKDDQLAAQWLHENMATSGEVFATNRNAQDMVVGEGVFHYYTAASQRQAFVESWRYAMDYSMDYHLLRHNLEQVSDVIFACETFEEAAKIAKENGIDYILLHLPTRGGQAFAGGEPVFVSETVLIYKL